jgi:hypothetical protein
VEDSFLLLTEPLGFKCRGWSSGGPNRRVQATSYPPAKFVSSTAEITLSGGGHVDILEKPIMNR